MRTPADKTVAFTFMSHPARDARLRWKAVLAFPPGATAESRLSIAVTDGDGEPVEEGVFEFAGRRLEVRGGVASIAYADFVAGKHEVPLWLHREGLPSIPGGLTFV